MTRTVAEIANNFYDEYNKKYAKVLNKYGCNTSELAQLQFDIENGKKELICTIKYYNRLPSGRFSTKAYEEKEKKVNVSSYLNIVTSIPLFGDTTKKYYTSYGYIPMLLTCFSWGDRSVKRVSEFKIINL